MPEDKCSVCGSLADTIELNGKSFCGQCAPDHVKFSGKAPKASKAASEEDLTGFEALLLLGFMVLSAWLFGRWFTDSWVWFFIVFVIAGGLAFVVAAVVLDSSKGSIKGPLIIGSIMAVLLLINSGLIIEIPATPKKASEKGASSNPPAPAAKQAASRKAETGGSSEASASEHKSLPTAHFSSSGHYGSGGSSRFVRFQSPYGFVHRDMSNSPLMENIPESVRVNKHGSTYQPQPATVVVQSTPTRNGYRWYIDSGFILDNLWQYLYGIVNNPLLGAPIAVIGGVFAIPAMLLTDSYTDQFTLVVDNALDHGVHFHLDTCSSVRIPAKCQIALVFKQGTRDIRVRNAQTRKLIEGFRVRCVETEGAALGSAYDASKIKFVYNIAGRNSYSVHNVAYKRKK